MSKVATETKELSFRTRVLAFLYSLHIQLIRLVAFRRGLILDVELEGGAQLHKDYGDRKKIYIAHCKFLDSEVKK